MTNISVIFEFTAGNRIALRASNFKTIAYNFNGSVHSFVLNSETNQKKYIRCNNPIKYIFISFTHDYKKIISIKVLLSEL